MRKQAELLTILPSIFEEYNNFFHVKLYNFNNYIEELFSIYFSGSKVAKDAEFRLRQDLLTNHSSKTLPSLNDTTPVTVTISLTLRQILDVVSTSCHIHVFHFYSNSTHWNMNRLISFLGISDFLLNEGFYFEPG